MRKLNNSEWFSIFLVLFAIAAAVYWDLENSQTFKFKKGDVLKFVIGNYSPVVVLETYPAANEVKVGYTSSDGKIVEGKFCASFFKKIDQPTCETDKYGTKRWRNNQGQLHRLDGPAVEYANGAKYWCQNGKLHRLDGPAIEYASGSKEWWQNDKLHRLDGPAVEHPNGYKSYWAKGRCYSEEDFTKKFGEVKAEMESTCEVDKHGNKRWYNNQGQLHRLDGPAIEYADGTKQWWVEGKHYSKEDFTKKFGKTKQWFQNGKLHRLDGPAIEGVDGYEQYWIEGKCYTKEDFFKLKDLSNFLDFIKEKSNGVIPVEKELESESASKSATKLEAVKQKDMSSFTID